MTYPVVFHLGDIAIPAHQVFETAGYLLGFQAYLAFRRRDARVTLSLETRIWIVVAALFGAVIGSKLLAWAESPQEYWAVRADPRAWLGGKTIVGGLIGGWLAVELAKRFMNIRTSTGDAYVPGLVIGVAVGRIGCFLTGLPDHTYGIHSTLPWAVDFGDGPRHPTQLYESLAVILLGLLIYYRSKKPYAIGELFRLFMLGYFTWRFLVEFIKPRYHPYLGLSAIQIASLCAAIACVISLKSLRHPRLTGLSKGAAHVA
jgi:phosphatidylglycerol---prolipoprotein diacylglyceryl transferase